MSHLLVLVIVERIPPHPYAQAQVQVKELLSPYFRRGGYDPSLPNSHLYKCDGWGIGGRYDGLIFGKEQHYNLTPFEYRKRYGWDVIKPEDNIRSVSEVPKDMIQHIDALVTPDGEWHGREEKAGDEWVSELTTIITEISLHYPSLLAVAVDCHY
ncbi:hypothetical protein [Vacuolonema iberomarrocanum]|uniref:hypothetical protein n=1 Tax=Vacuolonema iberomarrocanum TaxID=3454632 RepID=UPI0019EA7AFC|nr:hypothetical protein [filamentous cyanobacterium LEGE 07170]